MTLRWCCFFVASFLVVTHPAPAPIVEEPQPTAQPAPSSAPSTAPSTAPRQKRNPKPRISTESSSVPATQPKVSPAPQKHVSRGALQGTWVGTIGSKTQRTILVGTGSVSIDGGPLGRETGPIDAATANQVSWTTRPMSLPVKWTLTLVEGGNTARVSTKHLLGGQTGLFQRKQ